jgi:hypothetical protein
VPELFVESALCAEKSSHKLDAMAVTVDIGTVGSGRQSSRGLEHSMTLRVGAGRRTARQRLGLRRPSAAFSQSKIVSMLT